MLCTINTQTSKGIILQLWASCNQICCFKYKYKLKNTVLFTLYPAVNSGYLKARICSSDPEDSWLLSEEIREMWPGEEKSRKRCKVESYCTESHSFFNKKNKNKKYPFLSSINNVVVVFTIDLFSYNVYLCYDIN